MTHKKTYLLIKILFLLGIFLASFSCKPRVIRRTRAIKDTSLASVMVRRKLLVGVHKFYPPYVTYGLNNVITGFDVEVAREVARVMNVDIEFKPLAWSELIDGLAKHQIDCLWGTMSAAQVGNFDCIFSAPYMNSSLTVMVPADSIYSSIEELASKTVGFLNLTDTESAAMILSTGMKNFENLHIYNDYDIALDELRRRKIDALVLDIFSISNLINNKEAFHMFNEPLNKMSYSVVFDRNSESLRNRVTEVLIKLEYDGTLAKISRKWFGTDIIIIGK